MLVILDACDPAPLLAYAAPIEKYATLYGPACWAVLYQSEWRFRRERLARLRRVLSSELDEAIQAGG